MKKRVLLIVLIVCITSMAVWSQYSASSELREKVKGYENANVDQIRLLTNEPSTWSYEKLFNGKPKDKYILTVSLASLMYVGRQVGQSDRYLYAATCDKWDNSLGIFLKGIIVLVAPKPMITLSRSIAPGVIVYAVFLGVEELGGVEYPIFLVDAYVPLGGGTIDNLVIFDN